ncbi:MAG TPA: hypothetical protein VF817_04285 [Patescibacteria group bacterium]
MRENFFERKIEKTFPERVYYVKSEQDGTVLVAMNIKINGEEISWFDGTKERVMKIKNKTQNSDGSFSFEREDGDNEAYTFSKMTLDVYNEKVKSQLSSPEEFENEEDMFKAFETTINSAW